MTGWNWDKVFRQILFSLVNIASQSSNREIYDYMYILMFFEALEANHSARIKLI